MSTISIQSASFNNTYLRYYKDDNSPKYGNLRFYGGTYVPESKFELVKVPDNPNDKQWRIKCIVQQKFLKSNVDGWISAEADENEGDVFLMQKSESEENHCGRIFNIKDLTVNQYAVASDDSTGIIRFKAFGNTTNQQGRMLINYHTAEETTSEVRENK